MLDPKAQEILDKDVPQVVQTVWSWCQYSVSVLVGNAVYAVLVYLNNNNTELFTEYTGVLVGALIIIWAVLKLLPESDLVMLLGWINKYCFDIAIGTFVIAAMEWLYDVGTWQYMALSLGMIIGIVVVAILLVWSIKEHYKGEAFWIHREIHQDEETIEESLRIFNYTLEETTRKQNKIYILGGLLEFRVITPEERAEQQRNSNTSFILPIQLAASSSMKKKKKRSKNPKS